MAQRSGEKNRSPGHHFSGDLTTTVELWGTTDHHQRYIFEFVGWIEMRGPTDGGAGLAEQHNQHTTHPITGVRKVYLGCSA